MEYKLVLTKNTTYDDILEVAAAFERLYGASEMFIGGIFDYDSGDERWRVQEAFYTHSRVKITREGNRTFWFVDENGDEWEIILPVMSNNSISRVHPPTLYFVSEE